MSIGGSKSSSKSSSKSKSDLDPQLKAALYGNLADTQNFAKNTPYQALSGSMIDQYRNPYQQDVIDTTMADLNRSRQQAQMGIDDKATAAHAFGGSRHGVLGAQTNSEYDRNAAGILAGLNATGYSQALQTAQGENANQNDWAIKLRQLINQSLGAIPSYGTTTGSQKGKTSQIGFSVDFAKNMQMAAQMMAGGG
jgi:hypothetical protein